MAQLSINEQKNNETYKQNNARYSKLMFFQCSQHKHFYSYSA